MEYFSPQPRKPMYIIITNSKVAMSMSNTDFKEIWYEDSLILKEGHKKNF